MKLSQEQVKRIEQLARLQLSESDRRKYGDQLNSILEYIDTLEELDTTEAEKRGIQYPHHLRTREDVVIPTGTTRADLLACTSQDIISDQIAIRNIMK